MPIYCNSKDYSVSCVLQAYVTSLLFCFFFPVFGLNGGGQIQQQNPCCGFTQRSSWSVLCRSTFSVLFLELRNYMKNLI